MALPAEYNNIPVEVGEQGDPAPWGPEYTQLLTTIMQGSLVQNGDNFSLSTVDGDFGPLFGIVSIYLKSRSASIADDGFIRMAVDDVISWRNNDDDDNLDLSVNASDFLFFNGQKLLTQASPTDYVSSITGTANQVIASAATGAVTLSLPQNIHTAATPTFASETLTAITNQIILGTTRTVTITAPTPASASRTVTIPDLVGNYDLLGTIGAQTITGAKTFESSKLLLQEVSGTDVVTIAIAALAAGRTYTIPDALAAAEFVMTEGSQTINGTKKFASSALQLQEAGSTDKVTIAVATLAADRTYTVPDALGAASFVMTNGSSNNSYIMTDWASYTPTIAGVGTPSNVSFYWRQVGNEIFVTGTFTMGTVSGSTLSVTLPNSTVIATSKMPSSTALIGFATELHTGASGVATVAERKMVFTDGSTTDKVFWSSVVGSGINQKQTGTQDGATNTPLNITFSYAI